MELFRVGVLLLFAFRPCVVVANPALRRGLSGYNDYQNEAANYAFAWRVKDEYSGNDYGHEETRKGYDTSGEYHVLLPDGRLQTVTYNVDPYSGFQARINYRKASVLPAAATVVRPLYRPPTKRPLVYQRPLLAAHSITPAATFAPHPSPAKYLPIYRPRTYVPAQTHYPHNPVFNLILPERELYHSYRIPEPTNVHPLAAPKPEIVDEVKVKDPYLKTEAELKGKDFSDPFFYPYKRKISKSGRRKDDGRTKRHHHRGFRRF